MLNVVIRGTRRASLCMQLKECPLCAETMELKVSSRVEWIPGQPNPSTRSVREWVCRRCEHFEEVDGKDR